VVINQQQREHALTIGAGHQLLSRSRA